MTHFCTGWFDGVWGACCALHDAAYASGADKVRSDLELALCVAKTGHGAMALVMLIGVSIFGWLFYRGRRK